MLYLHLITQFSKCASYMLIMIRDMKKRLNIPIGLVVRSSPFWMLLDISSSNVLKNIVVGERLLRFSNKKPSYANDYTGETLDSFLCMPPVPDVRIPGELATQTGTAGSSYLSAAAF